MNRHRTWLAGVMALSACGATNPGAPTGSGTTTNPGTPPGDASAVLGEHPSDVIVTYDGAKDAFTFSDGHTTVDLTRLPALDRGKFLGYYGPYEGAGFTADTLAFAAETSSGSGYAWVFNSQDVAFGIDVLHYGYKGGMIVPTTETATYVGDYAGLRTNSVNQASGIIDGDVSLFADFEAGMISGTITNRQVGANSYNDVILQSASIADGAFSGTASGGANGEITTTGGSFEGLFAGAGGGELVGGIALEFSNGSAEVGGFVTEAQVP